MRQIPMHDWKINIPVINVKEHTIPTTSGYSWVVPIGVKGELRELSGNFILKITGDLLPYADIKDTVTNSLLTNVPKQLIIDNWKCSDNKDGVIDFDYFQTAYYTVPESAFRR